MYICTPFEVMSQLERYSVPLLAILDGKHTFDYQLDESFFKCFEDSKITKGDLQVRIDFDKKVNLFEARFEIKGQVFVNCDKCLAGFPLDVEYAEKIVFKITDLPPGDDPSIVHLDEKTSHLDFSPYLYEFTHLTLPISSACEEYEELTQDKIEAKDEDSGQKNPWSILKDINKDLN